MRRFKGYQTPFVNLFENKKKIIEDILSWPVVSEWDDFDEDDKLDLTLADGLPENYLTNIKILCYNLSKDSAIEYERLLNDIEVDILYEYYALSKGSSYIQTMKFKNRRK